MRRLIVLAALLALAATACKIETNNGAVINADGTATLVQEIGMDQEAQDSLMPEGTDPFAGQSLADMPGARTRSETRGDMTFWIIEVDLGSLAELEDQLTAPGQESLLTTFHAEVTGDQVTVTGTADTTNSLGSEADSFDPTMFANAVSAHFRLTLPGAIGTNNADSIDNHTLVWNIPVTGGAVSIQAESNLAGGSGFPWWILIVVGVLALAIIGYAMMQRRKPAVAGESADEMPPPAVEMIPQAGGDMTRPTDEMPPPAGEMAPPAGE